MRKGTSADKQYTTFERLVSAVLSWRAKRSGTTSVAGRGSLTDWDFFVLGALSKLVATGVTYPYVSTDVL